MTVRILRGDCRDMMRMLEPESIHCCVTSIPYWGLRDYGIEPTAWGCDPSCAHEWGDAVVLPLPQGGQGGAGDRAGRANTKAQASKRERGCWCQRCGAWRGAFGLEPTYQMFVANAVEVFREVKRVLRKDGTLWLNIGDSYATGSGARTAEHRGKSAYTDPISQPNRVPQPGLKPKDLVGIPWRVAFALQDDGWTLRQDNVWHKPNPMPESVTDRCTKSHEYIFMLTKGERYYFDQGAILEPISENTHLRISQATLAEQLGSEKIPTREDRPMKAVVRGTKVAEQGKGIKNNDSFHRAMTAPGRKKSGNKERVQASDRGTPSGTGKNQASGVPWEGFERNKRSVWTVTTKPFSGEFCTACRTFFDGEQLAALKVTKEQQGDRERRIRHCACGETEEWLSHFATFPPDLIEPCVVAGCPQDGVVLDPFGGAGTTGLVADRFGRNAILIELNPDYAEMARQRIAGDAKLFSCVELSEAAE